MRVLIYGDSLVFGKKPALAKRFDADVRFTGVVQHILGQGYEIIEEGLRARNLFGENSFFPERNGLDQFGPIFGSHLPLDLVVLILGTNDCNSTSNKSPEEFTQALEMYLSKIDIWCKQFSLDAIPRILVVASPYIQDAEVAKDTKIASIFGTGGEEKSKTLAPIYEEFCKKHGIDFFDANVVCSTSIGEGVHMDSENNRKLGEALAEKIKQ